MQLTQLYTTLQDMASTSVWQPEIDSEISPIRLPGRN